ncbi:acetyl-CoA carboxylase biotin carboxyl carrier protein [Ruminococcus champanellensis]|uniref:Biotin carboxyl carrier protein of acetyl-CoA carboxylase n=1 Tax=Ruminococcus champanellensis (strain DSM 18848 / JCM 17042 / KCTC 15320 / 18P13) TaxID=213810 RepID=D4LFF2_RUMC1|nr:acetyl-CoA carboxylase biotin carboxyl carrier protein [Ruminococcus champanellensis]CBL18347.1 acetyl-CoA carboxylase, biotin carboxyl carrier protein [Ruminococcus champanellensis 18P13 = JCM 17042]
MEKLFGQFDPELLERLARILRDNDLGELTLEDGDKKLTIKGKKPAPMPAPMGMPPVYPPAAPQEDAPTAPAAVSGTWVKAPLVGTYYAASSPESEPFVTVGKRVKKGDVLMIIESMKLMNEVLCEQEGTVAEILVQNGDAVEFDQPILRIE